MSHGEVGERAGHRGSLRGHGGRHPRRYGHGQDQGPHEADHHCSANLR